VELNFVPWNYKVEFLLLNWNLMNSERENYILMKLRDLEIGIKLSWQSQKKCGLSRAWRTEKQCDPTRFDYTTYIFEDSHMFLFASEDMEISQDTLKNQRKTGYETNCKAKKQQ
jgi:hypothetical protein